VIIIDGAQPQLVSKKRKPAADEVIEIWGGP